jgi:DNA-binding beta-propeller fold protein YncE
LEDKNAIGQVDAKTNTVIHTWPLGTCDEPSGLAIDVKNRRLFSVCSNNQMAILSADDGHVVATAPIGDGSDSATFDATYGNAFSSNSDGTLTIVHEDDPNHFSVVANVPTPKRSRTITLDEKTHQVILAAAEFEAAPKPTAEQPRPRPAMKADSFSILMVGH